MSPIQKKITQYKQFFGQDCQSIIGYSDKTLDFVIDDSCKVDYKDYSDNVIPKILQIKQVESETTIVDDILQVLQVSPREMLKLLTFKESKISEVFDFFYQHAKVNYILCNMVLCKVDLCPQQPIEKNPRITQEVLKIYSGHQIFLVIPYNKKFGTDKVNKFLMELANEKHNNPWGNNIPSEYYIKINFDAEMTIPYAQFGATINVVLQREDIIPILLELNNPVNLDFPVSSFEFKNMYYLENIIALIKAQHPQLLKSTENKYNYDQLFQRLSESSRQIAEHEQVLQNGPPYSAVRFADLYSDVSTFHSLFTPYLKKSLKYNLPISFLDKNMFGIIYNKQTVFPLKKQYNKFILELNNANYNRVMGMIQNQVKILVSSTNFNYLVDAYFDKERVFQWLLDSRKEASEYPVIIMSDSTKQTNTIGWVGKAKPNVQGKRNRCQCCSSVTNWICKDCGKLIRVVNRSLLKKCTCNVNNIDDIEFFCLSQWGKANNKPNIQSLNLTPKPSTSSTSTFQSNKHQPSSLPSLPPKPKNLSPRTYNILLLGASGTGKSTLVNSIPNYRKFPQFDDANGKLETVVPIVFTSYSKEDDGTMKMNKIQIGDPDQNENFNDIGQIVTQNPRKYSFQFREDTFNIIDTPGLVDSRGPDQDKLSLISIREEIEKLDQLHGICIVLKSNDCKLGSEFENCLKGLLSLFSKTVIPNLFYIFTHCGDNFGNISDSLNVLKTFSEKFYQGNKVRLEFKQNRIVYVESKAFNNLIAMQNNQNYKRNTGSLRDIWEESAQNINKFLEEIKVITPISASEIRRPYLLNSIGMKLARTVMNPNNNIPKEVSISVLNEIINETMSLTHTSFKDLAKVLQKDNAIEVVDLNQALQFLVDIPELKDDVNELINQKNEQNEQSGKNERDENNIRTIGSGIFGFLKTNFRN